MSNKKKAAGPRERHIPQHRKDPWTRDPWTRDPWTLGDLPMMRAMPSGLGAKIVIAGVAGATLAIPATSAFASPSSIAVKPGSPLITFSHQATQHQRTQHQATQHQVTQHQVTQHQGAQHQGSQHQGAQHQGTGQDQATEQHQSQHMRHSPLQPTAGQTGSGAAGGSASMAQAGGTVAPANSADSASPGPGLLLEPDGTFVTLPLSASNVQTVPAGSLIITSNGVLVNPPVGTYATPYGLITVAQTPGSGTPSASTATPGIATPGIATPGIATPGIAAPGTAAQGTTTPGTAAQGTTTPGTAAQGTTTQGTAAQGMMTQGTTTPGTAAQGTTTQGTTTPGTTSVNPGGPMQTPPQQPALAPATNPVPAWGMTPGPAPVMIPAPAPVPVALPAAGGNSCALSAAVICPGDFPLPGAGSALPFETIQPATATTAPATTAPATGQATAAPATTAQATIVPATGTAAATAVGTTAKAPPAAAKPPVQVLSALGGLTVADNGTVTPTGSVNLAFPGSGIGGSLPLSLPSTAAAQPTQPAFPPVDQNVALADPIFQGLIQNLGQQAQPPVSLPAPIPDLSPSTAPATTPANPNAAPSNAVRLASLDNGVLSDAPPPGSLQLGQLAQNQAPMPSLTPNSLTVILPDGTPQTFPLGTSTNPLAPPTFGQRNEILVPLGTQVPLPNGGSTTLDTPGTLSFPDPSLPAIHAVPAMPTSDNSPAGTTAVAMNNVNPQTGGQVASDTGGNVPGGGVNVAEPPVVAAPAPPVVAPVDAVAAPAPPVVAPVDAVPAPTPVTVASSGGFTSSDPSAVPYPPSVGLGGSGSGSGS
jgi:hypothetical protein